MTSNNALARLGLFGGALLCAGVTPSVSAQRFIVDEKAQLNYINIQANACFAAYGDPCYFVFQPSYFPFFQNDYQPPVGPIVDDLALEGFVYSFEVTDKRFEFKREVSPPDRPDDALSLHRAYNYVSFVTTAAATIEYELTPFPSEPAFAVIGDTVLNTGTTGGIGQVDVEAGALVAFSHLSNFEESTPFRLEIVGRPGCNQSDIAPPFGLLDLADVDLFIDAYFVNVNFDIADIAPPIGVYDLADIDLFINGYFQGCP